jgi:hypothetical protein
MRPLRDHRGRVTLRYPAARVQLDDGDRRPL